MALSNLPFAVTGAPDPGAAISPLHLALEAAHSALRSAALLLEHGVEPVIDPAPAALALEKALASLYDVFDGRGDAAAAAASARAATARAAASIAPGIELDPGFAEAHAHLARAAIALVGIEARLAKEAPGPAPAPPDLRASSDAPRLHQHRRASIAPTLKVPKPTPIFVAPAPAALPEPKTFAELGAAIAELKKRAKPVKKGARAAKVDAAKEGPPTPRIPRPGFAAVALSAMVEDTFLRGRARECFEDVAMAGMQRAPMLGDPWRSSLQLERRMLAAIDVIAAIGAPAIEHVPRLVADAPVKDPSRAFAVGMVLGSIGGRDALAAVEHALLTSDRDAGFVGELGAALKLAPHDQLPLALRTLLVDPDPVIRALAVDVLGYRGLATIEELGAAVIDHPLVARAALYPLACASTPELPGLLAGIPLVDPELRRAVWTAMAIANHPRATATLTEALDGEGAADAALLLALAGDEGDARRLTARAGEAPPLITAIGWAGAAASIGPLIDLLGSGSSATRLAAAGALERITGAGLWDEVDLDDDEILVPDPPEPDVGEPAKPRLVQADRRDPPPPPTPDRLEQPTQDPARWRAYWQERGHAYDLTARYRMGLPYSPLISLAEIDIGRRTIAERRLLQRELVIRTGSFVRFDPHDFVVIQEQAIRAWHPVATRASRDGGRWVRPARRPI